MRNPVEHLPWDVLQQAYDVFSVANFFQRLILSEDILHRHRTDDVMGLQQLHNFRLTFEKRLILRVQGVGNLQHVPIGAVCFEDGVFDQPGIEK